MRTSSGWGTLVMCTARTRPASVDVIRSRRLWVADRCYERRVPTPLAVGRELAVVPQQAQRSTEPPALQGEVQDGGVRGVRIERHVREQRAVHHLKGPLLQLERAPLEQVEDPIGMARAGSEADRIVVGERDVVGQAGCTPVRPGHRVVPTEVVLPASPLLLAHALRLRDGAQAVELVPRARGIAVAVKARMQADLVPTTVNVPDQRLDPRMLEQIRAVERVGGAVGEEVERAAGVVALADVHEEVERVVGIEAMISASGAGHGA